MVKTINRVGNSAGITLDKALLDLVHLKLGDKVLITVRDGSIVITPENVGFTEAELDSAAGKVFRKHAKTFKKLAE